MRVLFVCNGNVGRSQAAMEYYNQLRPGQAESAGTVVDKPGEKLHERFGAANIITAMREHGIDMSTNERTPLSEALLNDFDKVIIMADRDTHPHYLGEYKDVEFWEISDAKDKPLKATRAIRDQIKAKVDDLVRRTADTKSPSKA